MFLSSSQANFRVLLCSIHDLGAFAYPRCCAPLRCIPEMGTKMDGQCHETLKHHDNITKHEKVDLAWEFIYNKGHNVDGEAVEHLLKSDSLVPTCVSYRHFQAIYIY